MNGARMSRKLSRCQHLFPEVGGLVSAGILRIARAGAIAQVERAGNASLARQPGGHVDLVRVHGEMDEGALSELEDQVLRVTVVLYW